MRKWTIVAALVLGVALIAQASAVGSSGGETVLKFNTMVGVDGPFRGATNAIRGVPGAGAAWRVDSVDGKLKAGGRLDIDVEGLVLVSSWAEPLSFVPCDCQLPHERCDDGFHRQSLDGCLPGDAYRRRGDRGERGASEPMCGTDRLRHERCGHQLVRGHRVLNRGCGPGRCRRHPPRRRPSTLRC